MPKINKHARKILVVLFSLTILCMAAFMIYKIADRKRILDGRNTFTPIEINLPGNFIRTIRADNHTSQFIIMFFDPDCYYCHLETEAILENIEDFDGIKIYMLTTNEFDAIKEFENQYELARYPQIISGRITEDVFSSIYGITAIPSLMIYDENGVLQFLNSGYTPVAQILNILGNKSGNKPEYPGE
ncbi:MAG: peroxiredoxin family protein [Bacteroidales bacterium]